MTITIAPFIVDTNHGCPALTVGFEREESAKIDHLPITYWGIYLDDKYISCTSSKERTEKTKV